MKQSDIALIVIVASITLVVSYMLGNAIINSPEARSTEIEIAIPISAEFSEPSEKVFNSNSVNPTEKIIIGDESNDKPFEDAN